MLTHIRPCLAPVKFSLRNYSLSHPSRYVVNLFAVHEEEFEQSHVFFPNFPVLLTDLAVVIFFYRAIQESLPYEACCILHNQRP